MKYSKKIRGMSTALAFAFAFMVFSFSFAPKAKAAEYTDQVSVGWRAFYPNQGSITNTSNYNVALPVVNGTFNENYGVANSRQFAPYFNTFPEVVFSGPVKLYMSFFTVMRQGTATFTKGSAFTNPSDWTVSYINTNGQTGTVVGGLSSLTTFTPSSSSAIYKQGLAIEAEWTGSEGLPIRALQCYPKMGKFMNCTAASNASITLNCPSIRLITASYSAELESLDKVADELAAQSDLLLAMKGDIVAILQDICAITGDIEIAANLMNSYLSTMVTHLNNIKNNTANAASSLNNIYTYMATMLSSLETAIALNADAVEAAIEAQTAAMIAYLNELFNTGNQVPDETYQQQQDAENILDQMESLEKPDVETIVPEIDDYSDGGVSGLMSAIFSSNLIVTMMTLSASLAFGAYVLFGKRS